jgi:hypothetical protein
LRIGAIRPKVINPSASARIEVSEVHILWLLVV